MLVLIVDDDPEDIELLEEALGEVDENIECISVKNGEEGLLYLTSAGVRPDYIFSDINMPVLNGKQFLLKLKNHSGLSDIPVVILTTSKAMEDQEETIRLGAAHFITKPPTFTTLISLISEILSQGKGSSPT